MLRGVISLLAIALLAFTTVTTLSGNVRPQGMDELHKTGKVIMVTRNSPTTYYDDRDGATGYEYELAKAFAHYLGLELEILVADNLEGVMAALESGQAQFAAAGLSKEQTADYPLHYSPSYMTVSEYIVMRRGGERPTSLNDLAQSSLMVTAHSRHASSLRRWQRDELPSLSWQESTDLEASDLMQMVSDGDLDFTMVNSNEFQMMQTYLPNLEVAFTLGDLQNVAWSFPQNSDDGLAQEAFNFFYQAETGAVLAELSERFYGHLGQFDYVGAQRFLRHSQRALPRYLAHFQKAADDNNFDWRLLAAMGYQESHWNPKARSYTGVRGIMMLTQNTASELGIENRLDPLQSIEGGGRYLAKLRSRIDDEVQEPDRTWMSLAAYNVGYGHLSDARKLTSQLGKNPNLWIDVKDSLPLLSQRRYYRNTRYGYARGQEPVNYVQNIRRYYDVLVWNDEQYATIGEGSDALQLSSLNVTVVPPLL